MTMPPQFGDTIKIDKVGRVTTRSVTRHALEAFIGAFRVSDFDREPENLQRIMDGRNRAGSFSHEILRLCQKADADNLERLRLAFPDHVAVYEQWLLSSHPGLR